MNTAQPTDTPDSHLIKEVIKGNLAKFSHLVKKYQQEIFRYAYSLLHDHDSADDATQETFIKLFVNIKKINLKKPIKPWLYTVTKNYCFDILRKNKRLVELNTQIISDSEPVVETIIKKEEANLVKKAFTFLPDIYRKALHARFYEGLSYKEIAIICEVPINTIKTHIKRGKEMLFITLQSQTCYPEKSPDYSVI